MKFHEQFVRDQYRPIAPGRYGFDIRGTTNPQVDREVLDECRTAIFTPEPDGLVRLDWVPAAPEGALHFLGEQVLGRRGQHSHFRTREFSHLIHEFVAQSGTSTPRPVYGSADFLALVRHMQAVLGAKPTSMSEQHQLGTSAHFTKDGHQFVVSTSMTITVHAAGTSRAFDVQGDMAHPYPPGGDPPITLDHLLTVAPPSLMMKAKVPSGNRPILPMSLLEDILGGEVQGEWLRCPSPSHGPEDRSMAVKPSRRSKFGFVVHPHSARDTVNECRAYILGKLEGEEFDEEADEFDDLYPEDDDGEGKPSPRSTLSYAERLWDEAEFEPLDIITTYLRSRHIDVALPTAIRFNPAVRHPSLDHTGPAMLARVERPTSTEMVALHITWLKADGSGKIAEKAKGDARRVFGHPKGGVVKLQPYSGGALYLAEGIETGFADIVMRRDVLKAMAATTWAALTSGNLHALDLPSNIQAIKVVSDGDKAARVAINKVLLRYQLSEKRKVGVIEFGEGIDANDHLISKRVAR